MGASFIDRIVPASVTPAQLKDQFEDWQAEDAHENGHSYSGGWNMARGLSINERQVFPTVNAANEWLQDRCQKWEDAKAVRATQALPITATYGGEPSNMWLNDFSLLAQRKYAPRSLEFTLVACDQLSAFEQDAVLVRIPLWEAANKSEAQARAQLQSIADQIKDLDKPLPDPSEISRLRDQVSEWNALSKKRESELRPIVTVLRKRLAEAGTSRDVWVVGAWAAS